MQLGKFKRCKCKTLFGHCMVVLSKCTEYIDLLKFNNMVLIAYHMFGKSIQRHRVDHVGQPLINHEPFVVPHCHNGAAQTSKVQRFVTPVQ